MDKVIAILQARMQSKRLPGKIMVDLCGKPLIVHIIDRLKATKGLDRIVLATPENEAAYLEPLARDNAVQLVAGNSRDVLGRFYKAALQFPAPFVVRVTGDNPLIDPLMLSRCIKECKSGHWDMVGTRDMPLGTGAEVFPASLLDYMTLFGRLSYHREHVTSYLYEHEADFRVRRLTPPRNRQAPLYRLTVDTPEDLTLMGIIYKNLYEPGRIIDLGEAIRFLKDNPDFAGLNSHVVQRSWRSEKLSTAVA